MEFSKRILIWIDVIQSFLKSFWGIKCNILSAEDTVSEILEHRSLIRFGDGEFGLYCGKSIHYQEWSPELKESFQQIKDDFENEKCLYLLAVPKRFMTINGFALMKKRVYVSSWAQSRYYFKKNFRLNVTYGDSFLFEKNNKEIYSRIWRDESCPENVIFIHNSDQYARCFEDTYGKNVVFIQCPPQNAFEAVDELEKTILKTIQDNEWSTDQVMMTVSAGPAGKVLVYRLSKMGYWCVDVGHCWDDPLEGI